MYECHFQTGDSLFRMSDDNETSFHSVHILVRPWIHKIICYRQKLARETDKISVMEYLIFFFSFLALRLKKQMIARKRQQNHSHTDGS